MPVMRAYSCIALLLSHLIATSSCQSNPELTREVEMASGQIKLQIPQSWLSHQVHSVFAPDCASCSESEYQESFSDKTSAGVMITVRVFPGGVGRIASCQTEIAVLKQKSPRCIIGDTISESRKGYIFRSVAYKQSGARRYHALTKWVGRYRTVEAYSAGEDTREFQETVTEIQQSICVRAAFLNTAKL